jgi:hypothetical protein
MQARQVGRTIWSIGLTAQVNALDRSLKSGEVGRISRQDREIVKVIKRKEI